MDENQRYPASNHIVKMYNMPLFVNKIKRLCFTPCLNHMGDKDLHLRILHWPFRFQVLNAFWYITLKLNGRMFYKKIAICKYRRWHMHHYKRCVYFMGLLCNDLWWGWVISEPSRVLCLMIFWFDRAIRLCGGNYLLCISRAFFKRSLSDGNILRQRSSPMSSTNMKKDLSNSAFSDDQSQGGSKILSESSPEISTCESGMTISRSVCSLYWY